MYYQTTRRILARPLEHYIGALKFAALDEVTAYLDAKTALARCKKNYRAAPARVSNTSDDRKLDRQSKRP